MQGRICNFTTLQNLTGLSRVLVKPGNLSALRCYSTRITAPSSSGQLGCLPKPITFKNALCPTSPQLTKIVANNLIQRRSQSTHDHVNLWKLEKIVSAVFLPLLPACLILENSVLDSILAIFVVIHVHWGLEAIIIDYARPIVVGNVLPKICFAALYLSSILTLAGLLVLAYNGPGISKVLKQGWAIGKDK